MNLLLREVIRISVQLALIVVQVASTNPTDEIFAIRRPPSFHVDGRAPSLLGLSLRDCLFLLLALPAW